VLEFPRGCEPWGEVSEGVIPVRGVKGTLGVMDLKGAWIVEPAFQELYGFYGGLAAASLDGTKFGYLRMPVKK
jgi:hypothetical protein